MAAAYVDSAHVRIAAREGKGERVVLDVGTENDALGEGVDGSGRRSRTLQLASGQIALADVADVNTAAFRRATAETDESSEFRRETPSCSQPGC